MRCKFLDLLGGGRGGGSCPPPESIWKMSANFGQNSPERKIADVNRIYQKIADISKNLQIL